VIILHEVGVPGLKKVLILLFFLLPASLTWLSCGSSSSSSSGTQPTGPAYRAFVTNSVSAGIQAAGIFIVNAQTDLRATVAPISAGNNPGMMVLTPNRASTVVFSGIGTQASDNQLTTIDNNTQAVAAKVTLQGLTESFVVSPDSSTAYAAVPTAQVTGQSPGVVDVVAVGSGTIVAPLSCPAYNLNTVNPVCVPYPIPQPAPGVCNVTPYLCGGFNPPYHFVSIGNTGTRVLAFSEGSDAVANEIAVMTPSSINTTNPVITFVGGPGVDHPVWAYFNSDDTTAYIMNCGAECGGTQASIQPLDLTTNPPSLGTAVPVPAATAALVQNSSIVYLAGTPYKNGVPSQTCDGETTLATTCGVLTIFNLSTMSVVQPPVQPPYCAAGLQCPIIITDGYHTKLSMAANGQLFIGASNCTEIIPVVQPPPNAEIRGCLSIYNTLTTAVASVPAGGVVIPPETGDVTGIQPIATRNVIYVIQGRGVQGGSIYIYSAATDALQPDQITNLIGQLIDVKTVDF
jgi:hypothetical protein